MKRILLLLLIFGLHKSVVAQVGINNPNPDTSAILDLTSNHLGLLVPRLSPLERTTIYDPANGLLVYDDTLAMFMYYDTTYSGNAISKWTGLSPWRFRDDRSYFDVPSSQYKRNIYTDTTVRYIGIGTATPQSKFTIVGNLSVGTNGFVAPTNGIVVEGDIEAKGNIIVPDTVKAGVLEGFGTVPIGGIIMWSGNPNLLPNSWKLCDGSALSTFTDTSGTVQTVPDLRGRFIVGYESGSGTGAYVEKVENYGNTRLTGGQNAHSLSSQEMPPHVHDIGHGHTATDAGHTHPIVLVDGANGDGYIDDASHSAEPGTNTGTGYADITVSNHVGNSGSTGGSLGSVVSHENRPEYYVLAYIIRVK